MKHRLKRAIGVLATLVAMLALLNSNSTNAKDYFGCTADDPGECAAECPDGSPCCVGFSPNCSEDPHETKRWIDCGQGHLQCSIGNDD